MVTDPLESSIDVIIVGSGPAGSAYARTIGTAEPTVRMLMVEVGPAIPGERGDHAHNMSAVDRAEAQLLSQGADAGVDRATVLATIAEGRDPEVFRQTILPALFFPNRSAPAAERGVGLPAASMSSAVGGMGIHWATFCPRPTGSERVPFIPAAELDQLLDRAEALLKVTAIDPPGTTLLGRIRDEIAEEFDGEDGVSVRLMPTATQRTNTGVRLSGTGTILGDLEAEVPGFELLSETLARRVIVRDGAAVGVELEDRRSGEVSEVFASRIVVCADGLRTPQLLFASGIRPPALGHYLNDHFQVGTTVKLRADFDHALFASDRSDEVGMVLIPFSEDRRVQGGVSTRSRSVFRPVFDSVLDPPEAGMLTWYGAKEIQYDDAVEFSDSATDFFGMPAMTISYSHTEEDRRTIRLMKDELVRAASRLGETVRPPELAAGGSSLHYQGTVRMGEVDDGQSVCDGYSRVWGCTNLYVGGNGVIPTSTAANPTLTTVALAIRAASALARGLPG